MAFDGICVAALCSELNEKITGGRISKIAQPETDELIITVKSDSGAYRLLLSANASLPLIYLSSSNKTSPLTAPSFCMLLRKHIGGGRIEKIIQPDMERILFFYIEHRDEMGDLCHKILIAEIMGKHSNIIFCDDKNHIIDSIKHISAQVSSVREVLPGRDYFIPHTQDKINPLDVSKDRFIQMIDQKPGELHKSIYLAFNGISPLAAEEIVFRSSLSPEKAASDLTDSEKNTLYHSFSDYMSNITRNNFKPEIIYDNHDAPIEFAALPMMMYADSRHSSYDSMSQVLEHYYAAKNALTRIRQRSSDLRHIVATALLRTQKKYDILQKQLKDTEKKDKYRIYGELLNTYGYTAKLGDRSVNALNYYTNEEITIPLDPLTTPGENAKKYFDKYNKLKRTQEAVSSLITEVSGELYHLQSISNALDIAQTEGDLAEIREEMIESGYIRRKGKPAKVRKTVSSPLHYISSDGFDMYVGKNNLQNEWLTFQFATGNDWWFHAKGVPGSHVIVKCGNTEPPDRTFEEAGRLAAHYSKNKDSDKTDVDYIQKKNVKKPNKGKPGFVIYHTNYSLTISTDISDIKQAD